ncbi:NAD(P)/FAD-dependent oxidoreductase, partial [Hungatella hathewayi]
MIRISQLKLSVNHSEEDLKKKAAKMLKLQPADIRRITVIKQSVDARKKSSEVLFIYTVDVETAREDKVLHRLNSPNIAKAEKKEYQFPKPGTEPLKHRPVIIGSGPAGLFCALMLARAGYAPLIFERGERVDERKRSVLRFWQGGELNGSSNVQFGEGGAGTFSDGKLNTLVKDPMLRNRKVLEVFVEFGADPSILYKNKPHIGTDVLSVIVKNMREEIIRLGGTFSFQSCVTDFCIEGGKLKAITVNGTDKIETEVTVLAVGHSARDTFEKLLERSVPMEKKAFAVGLRIQHPQRDINIAQYGAAEIEALGAADYKVTHQCANGRGVYSFCMCPGGYVVDASSEPGRLAVNGMSYHARDGV